MIACWLHATDDLRGAQMVSSKQFCGALLVLAAAVLVAAKVDNIIHEVRFAEVYRHWSASETEKSIYVNALFTVGIEGVAIGDASRLLDKLYATAQKPEIQCRFRWRKDSIAFWDNRSCQHYATADYFPNERLMERVTIRGDKPF